MDYCGHTSRGLLTVPTSEQPRLLRCSCANESRRSRSTGPDCSGRVSRSALPSSAAVVRQDSSPHHAFAEFALCFCLTPLFLVVGVLGVVVSVLIGTVRRRAAPIDAVFCHWSQEVVHIAGEPDGRGRHPSTGVFVRVNRVADAVTDVVLCLRRADVFLLVTEELPNRVLAPVGHE